MGNQVDSFRFLDFATKKVVKGWIAKGTSREALGIPKKTPRSSGGTPLTSGEGPWIPMEKPLEDSTVAIISSGGIALKTDPPFDQEGERQNPWWGDPSYRVIPQTVTEKEVEIYHLHVDVSFGREDLDCVFPLRRLAELEASGEIGRVALRHYSFMGYTIDPSELLEKSVPAMIEHLAEDQVDLALLVPV